MLKGRFQSDPGLLLPELARFELALPGPLRRALGPRRSLEIGRIRNAYEAEIPPSTAFLRWMLEHPKRLTWPKSNRDAAAVFGSRTQIKRERLLAGEVEERKEALEELTKFKAEGSRRKWWAFEGFTSVDCRLETKSLLLLIEGKRTEAISDSTSWFPGRNQVIRNLEVARALAAGRDFAVLLCAETPIELPEKAWARSLPHLSAGEIDDLKSHYLGCASWSTIVRRLCPGLQLPQQLDDAIALCMGFRGRA
jgi:hypothetical protein